jgi:dTDP-glucose pyrophosphorylase
MVGNSVRFKEAGFDSPKWMIRIGSKSMLEYAIESILPMRKPRERFVLVLLQEHKSRVLNILDELNLIDIELIFLDSPTQGQAETVKEGILKASIDNKDRLIVWCCDSYIKPGTLNKRETYGNHIFLTNLAGNHWSFAKTQGDLVVETSEKNRISDLASIGLYTFSSAGNYLNLEFLAQRKMPEIYIAPLYNQLVRKGLEVKFTKISPHNFLSFGTPMELTLSAKKLGLHVKL